MKTPSCLSGKAHGSVTAVYLSGKQSRGGDPHPAVQRVHVGDFLGVVEAEDGAKPHHGQQQGEEHERGVQQLPGEFVLTPGQGDAVQHSSCGGAKGKDGELM